MTFKNRLQVQVNVCYEIDGKRNCLTLEKNKAIELKDHVEDNCGVVWWFTAV